MSKFQILHKTIDQHLLKERINVNVLEDYVNQQCPLAKCSSYGLLHNYYQLYSDANC